MHDAFPGRQPLRVARAEAGTSAEFERLSQLWPDVARRAGVSVATVGKMRARMEARAWPSLLIGDELTSSLDNNSRHHVLTTVRGVLEASQTAMLFLS